MWIPTYKLTLGFNIVDQLIAVIQRDQAAAMAYALAQFPAPSGTPAPVAVRQFWRGAGMKPELPCIVVQANGPDYTPWIQDEPPLHGRNAWGVYCDVGDFDTESVVWLAQIYSLTLMHVLVSEFYGPTNGADLFVALTLTENDGRTTRRTVSFPLGVVGGFLIHSPVLQIKPGDQERPTPVLRVAIEGTFQTEDFAAP
jgi:hypothetical protein